MKRLSKFQSDWYFTTSFGLVILSAILSMLILLTNQILPKKIPLFYSLPWGEMQLANQNQLFLIPTIVCLIALVNLIILGQLHQSQNFFKKLLIFASLVAALILIIATFKIIFIFL